MDAQTESAIDWRTLPPDKLLLSVTEAATVLGLGATTVRGMIARRELPIVRIRDRVLLPMDALREWVQQQTEPPQSGVAVTVAVSPRRRRRG